MSKPSIRIEAVRGRVRLVCREVSIDIEEIAYEMPPEQARRIAVLLNSAACRSEDHAKRWPPLRLVASPPRAR